VAVASAGPYANHLQMLQTDNHASTSSLFLQTGCPSCHPTNIVKALKALPLKWIKKLACTDFPTGVLVGQHNCLLIYLSTVCHAHISV